MKAQPAPQQTANGTQTKPAAAAPDYSGEAFVIEQLSDEDSFSDDGTGQQEQTARIRILTDAGVQRFGVLSFSYRKDRERLEIVRVRVTKPDRSTVDTPPSSFQDLAADVTREAPTYSDLREEQIPVKSLGIGDVLEWHIRTVRLQPDAPGQFWMTHSFVKDAIVLDQTLRVTVPAGKYVKVSSPDVKPEVREENGRSIYTWKAPQLNRPKEEGNDKKIQSSRPDRPSVQITTFRTWEEVGNWYRGLQNPKLEVTPAIQAKAAELTSGLKTNEEKERALYQFVSSKFRYISISFGDGWYQPHAASDVLTNQYGDCKDKHTLLAALLKAAGIEAWPALLGAGNNVDPDVPSPAQFNHVITYIPAGNSGVWLDSTPEVAPFGMLNAVIRDQPALVIPENGAATIKNTPENTPVPNEERVTIQAKLGTDGTLTGHFDITLRGDGELVLRSLFHEAAPKDWSKLAQNFSGAMGFGGTVRGLDVGNPLDTAMPFHLAYDYERKNYPDWENRRISPPMPPLAFPYSGEEDAPTEPAEFAVRQADYHATVVLPDGYSAELPADVNIDTPFAAYSASYHVDKNTLLVERKLIGKKTKLQVKEWDSYKKLVKSAADDQDQFILLVRADGVTTAAPARNNPEAEQLVRNAAEAMQRREFDAAREALSQAERLNPQQMGLWAMYGSLYAVQGQTDKAIDALQKEIQFHPGNEVMYRMLAAAEEQAGRREDEITTLSRWVKIAPENTDAALALVSVQLQDKRYGDAAESLAGPLKAQPDNPRLEAALLEALLREGKKADGLAVLTKMQQHPLEANELNTAAYVLADTNTEPALSEELAAKAILDYEGQSKDVTLANLSTDQLKLVDTLGAAWDTLGWAYYRAGDFSNAERYLNAAWLLLQHPAVADHLGQVYGREGKKAEAIHAYQLSLAVKRDQPETRKRLESLGGSEVDDRPTLRRGKPIVLPRVSPEEELSRLRTVPLPGLTEQSGSAEFFVLFSASGVRDARFIRGDEALKPATAALLKARYNMPFPDAGPERIARRGILSCSKYTTPSCTFVMLLPANTTN